MYNLAEFKRWLEEKSIYNSEGQANWSYVIGNALHSSSENWLEALLEQFGHLEVVKGPVEEWKILIDEREREREQCSILKGVQLVW